MKQLPSLHRTSRRAMLALLAGAAIIATPAAFAAHSSDIQVTGAWIRWLPAGLPAGGYMVLHNHSGHAIDLVGAESPEYYGQVMLHHSVMENGTMHMLPVPKVVIPAHGSAEFKPGGYHIMLMQPKGEAKPGDRIPVLLKFSDGTEMKVRYEVRKAGGGAAHDMQGMQGMQGMKMSGDAR